MRGVRITGVWLCCIIVINIYPGNFFIHLQELAAVDHSKVYYQPFRKSFYVEVPELAKLTPEGILVFVSSFLYSRFLASGLRL